MTNSNLKEVLSSIGKMDNDELNVVLAHIKHRRSQIGGENRFKFNIGESVSFNGRAGITYKGVIKTIKLKNAVIETDPKNQWLVPMNMLKKG